MEVFRGPIKAGLAAMFAVGLLLLFLNPPSLSGAEGMALIIGGGLVLALGVAWATVALAGRDSMPEHEFERLVVRSEELALNPHLIATTDDFDLLVADAIDALPEDFQRLLDTTPVWSHSTAPRTAPTATTSATPSRATTIRTASSSTRTRSSATSATTAICSARRWSARCATSWPITWAGARAACATWASSGEGGIRTHEAV